MLNDCSIDAIIAIDTDKNVIAWNTTAEKIHGKIKDEVIGKPLSEIVPSIEEDAEILNAIHLALKGIKSFVPASKKFRHRFHAENHFIPLKDESGIKGVMNLVHDVAHRIKAEERLEFLNLQLEKRYRQLEITSDELASFTVITSSKIKEPIRQIYTAIEHLIKVEAGRLSDTGKASFRRMQSSLNRMDLLLNDILSLAQISILQEANTVVELNELIKEVIADVEKKAEKNINLVVNDLCKVTGNRSHLYLLFYNLFTNAVKFNDEAIPSINISCKTVVLNAEMYTALTETEYYEVIVSDNGIGFDQADATRIFNMFETLHPPGKYKGSGIGLTLAKKIMHAHEGFITAESNPGNGTSFHCFFPLKILDNQ